MPECLILTNTRLALPDRIVDGWLVAAGGIIEEVGEGPGPTDGLDMAGDLLLPGLVELHTDHLESHLSPRPQVKWPALSALMAFDARIAAAGITTVFDCIRIGDDADNKVLLDELHDVLSTIEHAQSEGLLRASHRVHLRCEICADNVVSQMAAVMDCHRLDLISLIDHTLGARQFTSLDAWRTYYGGKTGRSEAELAALIDFKHRQFTRNYGPHRQALVELARKSDIVIASHDDATSDHVAESRADGIRLAEFPTTVDAAKLCQEAGIQVMMGAPNVVRGGSHSGNVAAEALAEAVNRHSTVPPDRRAKVTPVLVSCGSLSG